MGEEKRWCEPCRRWFTPDAVQRHRHRPAPSGPGAGDGLVYTVCDACQSTGQVAIGSAQAPSSKTVECRKCFGEGVVVLLDLPQPRAAPAAPSQAASARPPATPRNSGLRTQELPLSRPCPRCGTRSLRFDMGQKMWRCGNGACGGAFTPGELDREREGAHGARRRWTRALMVAASALAIGGIVGVAAWLAGAGGGRSSPPLAPTAVLRRTPPAGPTPTAPPAAAPDATATPLRTPSPSLTPSPSRGPTPPAPRPTPTPRPTTPTPLALQDLRQHLLALINSDRTRAALPPLAVGANTAAQAHAEEMLARGYLSHWGLDGRKPYMRYTDAGGVNHEAENASGPREPRLGGDGGAEALEAVRKAHLGFMGSASQQRNLLGRWHTRVNLGIACAGGSCAVVEQFEADQVRFLRLPSISTTGILSLVGESRDGFRLSGVQVWFDRLPSPVTVAQLNGTSCYDAGVPLAFVRRPPAPGSRYLEDQLTYSYETCVEPYAIPPGGMPPGLPPVKAPGTATAQWVTAHEWLVIANSFRVVADLSGVMKGPGVYTIRVWGQKDGEEVELSNYSVYVR